MREYRDLLSRKVSGRSAPAAPLNTSITLFTPADLGIDISVEETGTTFAENATIKARAFASASGSFALADDSGLEIDALGGEPGVRSSRYAGPTDADRIRAVLAKLGDLPLEKRTARFRCVVALAGPTGQLWTSEGTCEGLIAFSPRGRGGFGYDPIFYLPSLGRTMAQIPRYLKNTISHRAHALQGLRPIIASLATTTPDP